MEARKRTIFLAIFWGYIPLHKPYIGLIYGRYLQFGFLEWPLTLSCQWGWLSLHPRAAMWACQMMSDCRFSILDENLSTRRDPWYPFVSLGIPWSPATIADVCFHASMCLDIRKKLGLRRWKLWTFWGIADNSKSFSSWISPSDSFFKCKNTISSWVNIPTILDYTCSHPGLDRIWNFQDHLSKMGTS